MKYIKLFELFDEKRCNFEIIKDYTFFKIYNFSIDDIDYEALFNGKDNIWFFEYRLYNGSYMEVNKNTYKILSTISSILKDFIDKNNPNAIIMKPKLMSGEIFIKDKLNKRGRIFLQLYKYFTNLEYSILQSLELGQTVMILYKSDFNINELIKSYFGSFSKLKNNI